ncbi:MAG: hypothetical protein AAF721_28010 [Myxococcota bacterium]
MRLVTSVMLAATLSGCGKGNTTEAVCEHLLAVKEATAKAADPTPLAKRMEKCVQRMTVAREKMGETEWATFAPCAVESKDPAEMVACSKTLSEAAEDGRRKLEKAQADKEEQLKAKVMEAQKRRGADGKSP